jgi:L-lactate dehydrogenase
MPVSILSDGYAGIDGVCLSLPCVIGKGGVHRIMHPVLSETERTMLCKSAESIGHTLAMCRG